MNNHTPGTWRYFKNVDETFSVIPADTLTDESYAETVIAEVFMCAQGLDTKELNKIIGIIDGLLDRIDGQEEF